MATLSWYRECGIIPYTSDVDFGMRASDVESVDSILKLFRERRSLNLVIRYGLVEEALELTLDYKGLKVDIFFFYEERNQSYVACHYKLSNSYAKVLYHSVQSLFSCIYGREGTGTLRDRNNIEGTEYGPNWTRQCPNGTGKTRFFNKRKVHWDDEKKRASL
ncbi:hypothetical protein AVEN_33266-1 [Araneus ventricosus]|uniref:Uncharacterized protein n=1 Tax=Araneus ventricosus TaxID=182803 RepID=A0A4Y2RUG9_ARAVE|nr:hypothetical protein AVEN_33266-1 [Araneus ventricosus]